MEAFPIPARLAREIAEREHYMHRKPFVRFAFGLFNDGDMEPAGVAVFGTPPSRHLQQGVLPDEPSRVIELNRLWVHDDMPPNTESWFVSRALKQLPSLVVVSYADTAHGHHGGVYRALNFRYAGWTDMDRKTPRPDYQPLTGGLHSRDAFRNGHGGFLRRGTKVRYWITTGTPAERRALRRRVGWPSLDWNALPPPPVGHRQVRDIRPYLLDVAV